MKKHKLREQIYDSIDLIKPIDQLEINDKKDALSWISSGAEIFRIKKPATPPKHLIVYFALIDQNSILLVNHIAAERWLPAGGHVEAGELPTDSVKRECLEELNINANFLFENPVMISLTETVGKTVKHLDVSLWYALIGDKNKVLTFDNKEFTEIRWFDFDKLPISNCDPQLDRFIKKLKKMAIWRFW